MHYLGVDPGITGAFSLISGKGEVLHYSRVNRDFGDLVVSFHRVIEKYCMKGEIRAALEYVRAAPGWAIKSVSALNRSIGFWEGTFAWLDIPHTQVMPRKWQDQQLDPGLKKLGKEKSVIMVNRLYPYLNLKKSHHNEADAILIGRYAQEYWKGR